MSCAELIFLLLSHKKSLLKFVLGSSITYGAYLGAIKPSLSNSIRKVEGANIQQGKYRDSIKLTKAH
ncbi:hypothetical protein A6V39_04375 [Candidatus Mycoplasma haematobovis]|uniref:Uncharacterized protein n=1 Tax=Candidatus Mycoplasma haematobovis TaxID=432608 RepID=A0A1A9QDQ1_9MOLU|nr:hypothetical protein [Candidatus Mycoplasma haematobovis]OAL10121.1 hypothetical protein A6V39_04375 [Candidatus Mycoplasma haematobovis]